MNKDTRSDSNSSIALSFPRRRRLSHRDLLLEKGLQCALTLSKRNSGNAFSKHNGMINGRANYQGGSRSIRLDGSNNITYYVSDECEEDCSKIESMQIIRSQCRRQESVFDNDDNFHEVDGFFVLETLNESQKKSNILSTIFRRPVLDKSDGRNNVLSNLLGKSSLIKK